jgi:hypothetical protein
MTDGGTTLPTTHLSPVGVVRRAIEIGTKAVGSEMNADLCAPWS